MLSWHRNAEETQRSKTDCIPRAVAAVEGARNG